MASWRQTRYSQVVIVSRILPLVVATLLGAGCGGSSHNTPAQLPTNYTGNGSVFSRTEALRYVPKNSHWAVVASNLSDLSKRLPLAQLVRSRMGGQPKVLSVFNVTTLSVAGVAVGKAAGLVQAEAKTNTMALFVTVADPAKFVAFVTKHAGGAVRDETSGAARLLLPKVNPGVGVVLRGDIAFIVVASAGSVRDRVAVRLANIARADSLAESAEFRRSAGALSFGEQLGVYLSLKSIFGDDPAAMTRLLDREKRLKAKLTDKATNQLKAVLIRRELRMLAASKVEYQHKRKRAQLLSGLGSLAIATRFEQRAVRATIVASPHSSSPFRMLLAAKPATLQLLRAMTSFPLLAIAGHMRVEPLLEVVQQLTGAQGIPFNQVKMLFTELTKKSFDDDFVPMLTGEIGFAVTEAANGRSGIDILLGVRSVAQASALFEKLAADKRMARFRVKAAGSPRFRLPSGGQFVEVGVAGSAIVATTDATLFDRLSARAQADTKKLTNDNRLGALLNKAVHTSVVMISGKLLGQLLAPKQHRRVKLRRWRERIPGISRSADYMRALSVMVKLDRTITKVEVLLESAEQQYYRRIGAGFGEVLMIALPGAKTVHAYGGLFLNSDLTTAIAAARVPADRDESHKKHIKQRTDLLVQRDKLWRTISDLRKRDIARFMNKK